MAFSNTLMSPVLLIVLLFFFFTSVISCNTGNEPCPPSLPGSPILPETPPYLPGTPMPPILPFPPILPTTPMPDLPVTPIFPYPPTLPATPTPKDTNRNTCPKDVLKLGVCADMLGRSIGRTIGIPPTTPCCKILEGFLDFEAAVCLCTAIKANVLGVVFNFPIAINNVFNHCDKNNPSGFQCE